MNSHTFSPQVILTGCALIIMGALAGGMLFIPIPQANATAMTFILGALAGMLTVGGGNKIADKLTTSTGPDATIQPDAAQTH